MLYLRSNPQRSTWGSHLHESFDMLPTRVVHIVRMRVVFGEGTRQYVHTRPVQMSRTVRQFRSKSHTYLTYMFSELKVR